MGILSEEKVKELREKYPTKAGDKVRRKQRSRIPVSISTIKPKLQSRNANRKYKGSDLVGLRYAAAGFLSGKLPITEIRKSKLIQPTPLPEGVFRTEPVNKPKEKKLPGHGYVYFIRGRTLGAIKIGLCRGCPIHRLLKFQIGSPDILDLMGVIITDQVTDLETELHKNWQSLWLHGEWHSPGPDLLQYIKDNTQPHFPNCLGDCEFKQRATIM